MRAIYTSTLLAFATTIVPSLCAVNCVQPRSIEDPTGDSIASALKDGIETAVSEDHHDHVITDQAFLRKHLSVSFKITSLDESVHMDNARLAFSTIVTECVEEGNFWGGSITTDGCTYQIYNNIYPQDGIHNLAKRAKAKAKPKPKTTRAAAPNTTKVAAPKTSKGAAPPNTSKAATPVKPSASHKAFPTRSSSSASASATTNFANKCAQIGRRDTVGQLPERRDLEDMGFMTRELHDLIVKRGAKSGTGCGIKLAADNYPSYSNMKTAKAWGWKIPDSCSDYTWGGPLDKQAPKSLTTYESEHVLEWQTITGFLDYVNRLPAYQVKEDDNGVTRKTYSFFTHPDPAQNGKKIDFCQYFNATWAPLENDVTFKIGAGKKLPAWKNMAAEYPSNNNYKNEFILLQKNINAPVKANLWNTNAIYTDMTVKGKSVDKARETLQRVRRIIVAMKYHTHADIQATLKKQKERIGKRFEAIEEELPNNPRNTMVNGRSSPFAAYQGQNLKAKWDTYMDDLFVKAKAKAKQYIEDGIKDLKAEFLTAKKIQEAKPVASDKKAKKEERENLADFQKNIKDLEASYKTIADWKKPW